MGAQLVGRAFVYGTQVSLKPNEFRLLTFMALTALDSDTPPKYFASRAQSALALGRMVSDNDADPEAKAAFQRVKEAVAGLVRIGAIERTRRGREGQRAEFILRFAGTDSVPLESTESVPLESTDSVRQQVRNPYPQGTTEEPLEEQTLMNTSAVARTSLAPVDNSLERTAAA